MIIRDQKTGRILSAKKLFVLVPMLGCFCGCGELVKGRDSANRLRLYVHGHNDAGGRFKKGVIAHNWKGGKQITHAGYVTIASRYDHPRNHTGRVFEHILVMEKELGRPIGINEIVHHKNGVRTDNRPENLEVMIRGKHQTFHNNLRYHKT